VQATFPLTLAAPATGNYYLVALEHGTITPMVCLIFLALTPAGHNNIISVNGTQKNIATHIKELLKIRENMGLPPRLWSH
jgi:hypothetical protein